MTTILARYYGPKFAKGQPRQIVIHSVESGIIPGLARSLAAGWFRNPGNQTSAHNIAGPDEAIDMVPDDQRAWHCGNGNSTSWGKEHTGRAAFTTAQWTTPDGLAMLRHSAIDAARRCKLAGIPVRWLSLTQLANDEKGFCTHNDMRLVRGGTTHTDPGPGFPYDLYLQMVREELGQANGFQPAPSTPPAAHTLLGALMQASDTYVDSYVYAQEKAKGATESAARAAATFKLSDPDTSERLMNYLSVLMRDSPAGQAAIKAAKK